MDLKIKDEIVETVEGSRYQIISVISEGNMSVVYRARRLVGEEEGENVLLKAFIRPADFEYEWYDYEEYVAHELEMNRVIRESEFHGALTIEYAEHGKGDGIQYGVITNLREGKTLQEYIYSPDFAYATLRDRIAIAGKITRLVNGLHEICKIIHGDINPGNIYMLETGAERSGEYDPMIALLDFGSSRYVNETCDLPLYTTEDYASAEIVEGKRKQLVKEDDWVSCLGCLWYCLSGYSVNEFEMTEEHIEEVFKRTAVAYERNLFGKNKGGEESKFFIQKQIDNYDSVLKKIKQIYEEESSFSSILTDKLEEILDLLDKTGASKMQIFEKLREEYCSLRESRFSSLRILENILPNVQFDLPQSTPRFIRSKETRPETLKQIIKSSRESVFMVGDGGMGKTTSLIGIMDDAYDNNVQEENPVVFLELCVLSQDYRDWYGEQLGGTFIEQFIASYLTGEPRRFLDKDHPYIAALQEELFRLPENGKKEYTVLLDGMNEIGFINDQSKKLFYDTINRYLRYAKNLRLVITGRNDVYELSGENLLRVKALGLDDSNILSVLQEAVAEGKISAVDYKKLKMNKTNIATNESRLWNCLRIPFFLMMYCMSSNKKNVESQGEILKNFFHDKRELLSGKRPYGERSQAKHRYREKYYALKTELSMEDALKAMLDFMIPEIAIGMVERNNFFITQEEIQAIIQTYFDRLETLTRKQKWTGWYYGYTMEIQLIFREIRKIDNGKKIPEYACTVLGIMRATANHTYFFTHQYFRDYFAACALINRMLLITEERAYTRGGWKADSPEFSKYVYPLQVQEMSDYICALTGEILGERKNLPVYNYYRKRWQLLPERSPEQEVLTEFLDCYRYVKDMNMEIRLGLENIISILKKSRIRNDGSIDFSNIDFSGLDVGEFSLKEIIFSHMDREENTYGTDFRQTRGILKAILKDEKEQKVVCCGIHSEKRKILILNEYTHFLTELNLESGESRVLMQMNPGYISAYYVGEEDDILLIRVRTEDTDEVEENDNSEAGGRLEKRLSRENIELTYFFQNGKQKDKCGRYGIENVKECLGVSYDEKYRQLSMFAMIQEQMKLLIIEIPEYKSIDEFSIKKLEYTVPLQEKDISQITRSTFMFTRLDEENYLLGDCKAWKWNIGKWNIKDRKLCSVFYLDKGSMRGGFQAVCCGKDSELLYFSERNISTKRMDEEASMDAFSDWSMHTENGEMLCMVNDKHILLWLCNGTLTAFRIEEEKEMWNCDSIQITQIFTGNGLIIANAENGIYEIDMLDGGERCLQQYQKKKTTCLIGRTTNCRHVLLYESTGIVKWIDIHNGSSFRQVALQYPEKNKKLENIFYDEETECLYGAAEDKVYEWEGWTGSLCTVSVLSYDRKWKIYNVEFDFTSKTLDVYFEREMYETFPMQKRYFRKKWLLEKKRWMPSKAVEHKEIFRKIYSDETEIGDVIEKEKTPDFIKVGNAGKINRGMVTRLLDFLRLDDDEVFGDGYFDKKGDDDEWYLEESDWWDDEIDDRFAWHTKYRITKNRKKSIYMKQGRTWKYVDNIKGNNQVIGITRKGILYTVQKEEGDADLKLCKPGQEEMVWLGKLAVDRFTQLMVIGDIFVGLARAAGTGEYKDRIYFWNVCENEIYDYEITEKVYTAGCPVNEKEIQHIEDEKLASMEGMKETTGNKVGKIRRIEKKSSFEAASVENRIKQWNYPVLFCVAVLIITDYLRRISIIGSGMNNSKKEIIAIAGVQAVMFAVTLFIRLYYPEWICTLKKKKLYKKKIWIISSVVILFAVNEEINHLFGKIELLSPSVSVFFLIPCICLYFYECPVKDMDALWSGYAWNMLWLVLVLVEPGQDLPVKLEVICCIVLSNIYIIIKSRQYLHAKSWEIYSFIVMSMAIITIAVGIERRVHKHTFEWEKKGIQSVSMFWSEGFEHARENITKYKFVGTIKNLWKKEYLKKLWPGEFPLNYVMEQHGWICGIVIIGMILVFLYFFWKGAVRQKVMLDRCICVSCAIFFSVKTVAGLLPVAGIGFIRPGKLPFWGGSWKEQLVSWTALSVYMAFYKAHRRSR